MSALGHAIPLLGTTGAGFTNSSFKTLDAAARFEDRLVVNKRYAVSTSIGGGIALAQTQVIRPGRIINEVVRLQESVSPAFKYTWTLAEQIHMAQALSVAIPRSISEQIHVAQAMNISLAVTVLQGLGIAPTPLPSLRYTQSLVQGLAVSSALSRFLGGNLAGGIGVHEALSKQFVAHPNLGDGIGLASALSNKLILHVTAAETIGIDQNDILKMIYNGRLADGVEIVAGYVSPDGNFTTWAINTRTGAVTEYGNYAFNSFAQIEDIYYGASSSGLYKLVGDDDAGDDIIANIKSGFAQWAGAKFTMFKGVYLGIRGEGDYVLKLTTGDGKEYNYAVVARDMRSTKVHVGKGLRARYFAFELVSTGQDFDLDTIEFVPLVADRRV